MKYNMTIRVSSILAVFGILNTCALFATEEKDPLKWPRKTGQEGKL